jgi:hypothetical protein
VGNAFAGAARSFFGDVLPFGTTGFIAPMPPVRRVSL